jgi:hypothetical protein
MGFLQSVHLVLQIGFRLFFQCEDLPLHGLIDTFLAFLFDRGHFAIELNLHRAECGFERVRVFRLDLVDESNNAVVVIEVLAGTLEAALFADDLSFKTLIGHVC